MATNNNNLPRVRVQAGSAPLSQEADMAARMIRQSANSLRHAAALYDERSEEIGKSLDMFTEKALMVVKGRAVIEPFGEGAHADPDPGTGPVVSASGNGASRAVEHYSPDSGNGDTLTRQYDEMARRMDSLEKAVSGMASLLVQMAKADGHFPESETADKEDDKREDDETSKGQIPALSLGDMFATMAGKLRKATEVKNDSRSRSPGGPPDFSRHAVAKSVNEIDAALASGNLSLSETIDLETYRTRLNAAAAGKIPAHMARHGLHRLPPGF